MRHDIRSLVGQRVDAVSILKWGLVMGLIYGLTKNGALIAGLLTAFLVTETVDILEPHPAVDERWVKVGLGGVLLFASAVWLWAELREPTAARSLWLPVVAIGGSLWVLLDARADFVHGRRFSDPEPDDEPSASEAMLVMQHAQLVAKALQAGPKTVDELAAACDLTESRIREVIEITGRDGTIYPVDREAEEPRYALDDRKMGLSGFGRQTAGGLTTVFRRLLRPFVDQF